MHKLMGKKQQQMGEFCNILYTDIPTLWLHAHISTHTYVKGRRDDLFGLSGYRLYELKAVVYMAVLRLYCL